MESLIRASNEIMGLELARVQLKKDLLLLKELQAEEQKQIDLIEHLATCSVYLNDIEKRYANDSARKAGVKSICLDSSDYIKSVSELERLNKEIDSKEIELRLNQINIDLQKRLYEIALKVGV